MKKKQRKKQPVLNTPVAVETHAGVAIQQGSISLVVLAAIVIGLLIVSNVRNRVYKTPVTLWADASVKSASKRRTHENYGQALSTAGFYDAALREFNTVLALRDDGSVPMRDLYREIGVVYFRLGRIDDSIKSWQTGLLHAPYDPSLLNNLSVAYLRQQRIDEAETAIRQALMSAPYMPQALNSLGEILMIKGKHEEALTYFLRAIEVNPEVPARYWNAALAFEKNGRYDMAYEYANRYAAMERDGALKARAAAYLQRLQARNRK